MKLIELLLNNTIRTGMKSTKFCFGIKFEPKIPKNIK